MNGFTKFVSELTFKQLLMYVIILVIVVIFILWAKGKIEDEIAESKENKKQKEFEKKIDPVLQAQKEVIATDVSFTDSEYIQMADAIQEAMNDVGTDEEKIKAVFQRLKTKSDFLKLVEFFGTRTIHSGWLWLTHTGTLYQLLESELSASDKEEMNQILRNISVSI